MRTTYVVLLLAGCGLVAVVTAILIAWPAIAYLGSKIF